MKWFKKLFRPGRKLSEPDFSEADIAPAMPNPEDQRGLYLLSDYGHSCQLVSVAISPSAIEDLVNRIEWEAGFYQVICTRQPGVSMEVGGSLNGADGLSALYRNRPESVECVVTQPPENRAEMIQILISFALSKDPWHEKYTFE
jgi:hypothetical protein